MKKTKGLLLFPLVLLGFLAGFLLFRKFVMDETAYMTRICESQLETYANENASGIKEELTKALEYVNLVGGRFESEQIELTDAQAQILRIAKNNTSFSHLFLSDLNGQSISNTGAVSDASQKDFYKRALFGESTILLETSSIGQENVIISAPVLWNGKVVGAVHGELELYPLYKIMNANSFDGLGYATLINTSGEYIIRSDSEYVLNTGHINLFEWLKNVKLSGGMTADDFKNRLESNESGLTTLKLNGNTRELCYIPIGINDWYLAQQVSDEYIESLVAVTNRNVLLLVIELGLLLLLSVVAIAFYIEKQRRIQATAVKKFVALANNIPGGVAELEIGNGYTIRYANDGFYGLTGYSKSEFELTTHNGHDLILQNDENDEGLLETVKRQTEAGDAVSVECRIRKKDGTEHWLNTVGTVIERKPDGTVIIQSIITDITFQKQQTALAIDRARHEKMTHLYDKVSTGELIDQVLTDTGKEHTNVVMILDIDNFKHINDTYGHQIGDVAIIAVANKLKEYFRNTDIIGRVGGDEFVVCMQHVPDDGFVKVKLESLLEKIKTIVIANTEGLISCSLGGVIVHPFVKTNYQGAFKVADENLYTIKKNRKGAMKVTNMYLDSVPDLPEENK